MSLPTALTLFRIATAPLLALILALPISGAGLVAAGFFGLAALSDWLDGYLARHLKQTSRFGAFLDPVADKLVVATVLVMLVTIHPTPWFAFPAAVILCREIAVSALREWMAEVGNRSGVAVSAAGKIKMVLQFVAILLFLLADRGENLLLLVPAYIFLYGAVIMTSWSMVRYLAAAWPDLDWRNKGLQRSAK